MTLSTKIIVLQLWLTPHLFWHETRLTQIDKKKTACWCTFQGRSRGELSRLFGYRAQIHPLGPCRSMECASPLQNKNLDSTIEARRRGQEGAEINETGLAACLEAPACPAEYLRIRRDSEYAPPSLPAGRHSLVLGEGPRRAYTLAPWADDPYRTAGSGKRAPTDRYRGSCERVVSGQQAESCSTARNDLCPGHPRRDTLRNTSCTCHDRTWRL